MVLFWSIVSLVMIFASALALIGTLNLASGNYCNINEIYWTVRGSFEYAFLIQLYIFYEIGENLNIAGIILLEIITTVFTWVLNLTILFIGLVGCLLSFIWGWYCWIFRKRASIDEG